MQYGCQWEYTKAENVLRILDEHIEGFNELWFELPCNKQDEILQIIENELEE